VIGAALSIACGGDDGGVSGTTGQEATSVGSSVSVDPASAGDDDDGNDDAPADDDGGPGGPGSSGDPTDATMGPGPTDDDTAGDTSGTGIGCEGAPWLVCEDFEAATVGENPDGWDLRPSGVWGGGGMGTTDELAASGGQSFRLQSAETGAQWLTYMGDISAFADGHWGRMYFRMSDPVPWPNDGVIHGDLFEARGNWEGSTHQVRWAVINNPVMQHNWGYNVQTSNAGEFIHETGYVYPWTQRWLCIEWHHDRVAQAATLWVDGEEILAVTAADDPQIPVFDDISVGWANYQPASPQFVVHIDDVALHSERIGCGG
jgi:hypothetical protein